MSNWEHAGYIGVDAGLCWIGDPCYIIHPDEVPEALGKNWGDFCDNLGHKGAQQFHHDSGHGGLGVVISTGWGDGIYPVQVKKTSDGRIAEVRVIFINEDKEDLYEDEDNDFYDNDVDGNHYDEE